MSDETPLVAPLGNNRYLVTQGDERLVAHAVVSGRYTWVSIGPQTFVIDRSPSSGEGRRATRDDQAALASPMPASVVRVNVEAGQQVSSGEVMIVLEAMKMELTIAAPRDARVKKVDCRPGELVQPGVPLIELE